MQKAGWEGFSQVWLRNWTWASKPAIFQSGVICLLLPWLPALQLKGSVSDFMGRLSHGSPPISLASPVSPNHWRARTTLLHPREHIQSHSFKNICRLMSPKFISLVPTSYLHPHSLKFILTLSTCKPVPLLDHCNGLPKLSPNSHLIPIYSNLLHHSIPNTPCLALFSSRSPPNIYLFIIFIFFIVCLSPQTLSSMKSAISIFCLFYMCKTYRKPSTW